MVRKSGSEYVSAQRAEELFAEAELFDTLERVRNRPAVDTRAAVSPRRVEAHRDTVVVPQPMMIDCTATNDFPSRTLFVRLPDKAGGTQRAAWRRA